MRRIKAHPLLWVGSSRYPFPVNTTQSNIHRLLESAGASFVPFGPASADDAIAPVELVETFDEYHAEYAAIRKSVGIFDQPQRGLVEVTGNDRLEFLHRMITNDTRTLLPGPPGQCRRAFLLSKQGRITADMIVMQQGERTLIDLDLFQAAQITAELDKYLFSEDVKLRDVSAAWHHIALLGPLGLKLIEHLSGSPSPALEPMQHATVTIDGAECVVYRRDETGSMGLQVIVGSEAASGLFARMIDAVGGLVPDVSHSDPTPHTPHPTPRLTPRPIPGRGIGWLAYNTARIEAGTPVYHVDFGPDSLPGETGLLEDAVSFTKGCYLGQEIVARMKHLGHPKKIIVGLKCEDDRLPIAGAQVYEPDSPGGTVIGGVSSSTLSPLLGSTAIALAVMKWNKHKEGTIVAVPAEGGYVKATVCALPVVKVD